MRRVSVFAVTATLAGAFFVQVTASQAQDGNAPWCAVVNIGFDEISRSCIFQTVEDCVPHVLAGNRGSCEPNSDYSPTKHRPKRHFRRPVKGY